MYVKMYLLKIYSNFLDFRRVLSKRRCSMVAYIAEAKPQQTTSEVFRRHLFVPINMFANSLTLDDANFSSGIKMIK
jgi:GR25 family glycosyltransferase involved in LPS biosynthesis